MEKLNSAGIRTIANEAFTQNINALANHAAKSTKTTGDDAYRLLQILTHLKGDVPIFGWGLGNGFEKIQPGKRLPVPGEHATIHAALQFAHTYDAYNGILGKPSQLEALYAPFLEKFQRTKTIEPSLGVDFLRGWLFLLARTDHFNEGYWEKTEPLWRAILKVLRKKAKGGVFAQP